MCFNYKVSLLTFLIGTISSFILIKNGNPKYKSENIIFGIFLIFIASIQFMDFLFWIDLNNKLGINHIMTIIGPLINLGQPLILYIIKLIYFTPELLSGNYLPILILILNLLYLLYLIRLFINFISNEKLVTSTKDNHLKWPWIKYSIPLFYLLLMPINIFYLTNFKYSLFLFFITYLFFYLSHKYFSYNISELWCFFGSFIPIILYVSI